LYAGHAFCTNTRTDRLHNSAKPVAGVSTHLQRRGAAARPVRLRSRGDPAVSA